MSFIQENKVNQEIKEIEIKNDDINGYFLVSFLNPKRVKDSNTIGNGAFKIRGYFQTVKEAQEVAEKLQKQDPHFDIFLGEMGKWMPFDPNVDTIDEQIYREKELNELMSGYKKQRDEQNKIEQDRRNKIKSSNKTVEDIKQEELTKTQIDIQTPSEIYENLQKAFNDFKNNK